MAKIWLVTNAASGSAAAIDAAALETALGEHGFELVGRTAMFDEALPDVDALTAAGVETLLIHAGDGTINATAAALDAWPGRCILLPGGTMNMLPRALHGEAGWAAILAAAAAPDAKTVTLPYVAAGGRRAYVAAIAGPVTAWARPREAIRRRRFGDVGRTVALAWRRTFAGGVRVAEGGRWSGKHRAVVITPAAGGLKVATVDTRSLHEMAAIGWHWVTGDWTRARAVNVAEQRTVTLRARRRLSVLFDGEPAMLEPVTQFTLGETTLRFVSTVAVAE